MSSILSPNTCHAHTIRHSMMTSSNGNIFRATGPLCGEFTGPLTKASDAELLVFSLICDWINRWVNNREAGDLRRHHVHYDVIVMGKDQPHISHIATKPWPTMHHSERKSAPFWCIVGYGTGALWDLWYWSIRLRIRDLLCSVIFWQQAIDLSHRCGRSWRLVANQQKVMTDCARCYMFLNITGNIF